MALTEQEQRITALIAVQLGLEQSQVTPAKSLAADLGADSLDSIEIVMALEDEFAIGEIGEESWNKVSTVKDVFSLVAERVTAS